MFCGPTWQGLLYNNFPGTTFATVPGSDLARLDAMLSGTCGAALMTDYNADWSLGPAGDPLGYYCTFSPSGTIMNQNTLAIPFNSNTLRGEINLLNRQIALGLSLGDYTGLYQARLEFCVAPHATYLPNGTHSARMVSVCLACCLLSFIRGLEVVY